MALNEYQQHLEDIDDATIQTTMAGKEIAWNKTKRRGIYKHADLITFDYIPSEAVLASTVVSNSGAKLVGVDASSMVLTGTSVQAVLENIDTELTARLKKNGSTPFTGDQSLGSNSLTNVAGLDGPSGAAITVQTTGPFAKLTLKGTQNTQLEATTGTLTLQALDGTVRVINSTGTQIEAAGRKVTIGKVKTIVDEPHNVEFSCPITLEDWQQITPAGSTQGSSPVDAAVISASGMFVTNQAITLPKPIDFSESQAGAMIMIKNWDSSKTLKVFPALGHDIDHYGTNNSISLLPDECVTLMTRNSTFWMIISKF